MIFTMTGRSIGLTVLVGSKVKNIGDKFFSFFYEATACFIRVFIY